VKEFVINAPNFFETGNEEVKKLRNYMETLKASMHSAQKEISTKNLAKLPVEKE